MADFLVEMFVLNIPFSKKITIIFLLSNAHEHLSIISFPKLHRRRITWFQNGKPRMVINSVLQVLITYYYCISGLTISSGVFWSKHTHTNVH